MNKDVTYQYKDQNGAVVFEKIVKTVDKKTTIYWNDITQNKWFRNINELKCDPVPYHYDKIQHANNVILFFSEQDADIYNESLTNRGKADTISSCIPNNQWDDSYCSMLLKRNVIIVPRFSEKAMAELWATRLYNPSTKVKVINLQHKDPRARVEDHGFWEWIQNNSGGTKAFEFDSHTLPPFYL